VRFKLLMLLVVGLSAWAQDPTGVLEGQILDPSEAVVSQAAVSVHNSLTGLAIEQHSARDGVLSLPGAAGRRLRSSGVSSRLCVIQVIPPSHRYRSHGARSRPAPDRRHAQ
jgi:hypothetical protein